MEYPAHVNVIDRNTTLFSLDGIDSAAYALSVWGCPNGTLRFSGGATLYDIYYAAEP
jgi:hypothetical protein